jgi:hypothetical protein
MLLLLFWAALLFDVVILMGRIWLRSLYANTKKELGMIQYELSSQAMDVIMQHETDDFFGTIVRLTRFRRSDRPSFVS